MDELFGEVSFAKEDKALKESIEHELGLFELLAGAEGGSDHDFPAEKSGEKSPENSGSEADQMEVRKVK